MLTFLLGAALASTPSSEPELTWQISAGGANLGTRTVKVKTLPGDQGSRRVIESWTQLDGMVGPIRVAWRQRLTAHADGTSPASFHSVIDDNGAASEIQGRWTPSGWVVTSNVGGRVRSVDHPVGGIDLSTADLMDPERRVGMGSKERVRLLTDITGEVLEGPTQRLGASEVTIAGTAVPVDGVAWTSPEGRSEFWFSAEGWLVKYETQAMGLTLKGVLTAPPPGGIDDFPVAAGRPTVEIIPL
jgi:hypothetical protein